MSAFVEIPLPLNGLSCSAVGEKNTTPSCMNVRPLASGAMGSRPGLVRPYGARLAPSPVQWVGQMDCGYGDSVGYYDGFDYADGPLSGATGSSWSAADANLQVANGSAVLNSLDMQVSSGEYQGFAGDQWDDFVLEARLQWNYPTSCSVEFWVGSDANGTGGVRVGFNNASRPIQPSLAFVNDISITAWSPVLASWTTSIGPHYGDSGGTLRVAADAATVQVWWNGRLILTLPRVGAGVCTSAGFTMFKSNAGSGSGIADSVPQVRLLDWRLTTASRAQPVTRKLLAVAAGNIWAEQSAGVMAETPLNAQPMAVDRLISAAACGGTLLLVDGVTPQFANPSARGAKCHAYVARKGLLPASAGLVASWRNRVILAAVPQDPQNYYMSRQGDPWDFELDCDDSLAATSGDGNAGKPAEPIRALCPLGEEVLVLGCTRSLWVLRGDPLHGGSVQRRVDQMGIAGPNAWAVDAGGNFYFLSDEGLFVMDAAAHSQPKCLGRIAALQGLRAVQAGRAAAQGELYITLAYDPASNGLLVFLTPVDGTAGTHWFFDIARGAIYPESYPPSAGPVSAASATAGLLLGGADGWLYRFDDAATSDVADDDTQAPIESSLTLCADLPHRPMAEATMTALAVTLSPGAGTVQLDVRTGDTLAAALAATPLASGTCSGGWNVHRFRARGRRHLLRLGNSAAAVGWAIESAAALSAGEGGR